MILFPFPGMSVAQVSGAYLTPPFDYAVTNNTLTPTTNPTIVTVFEVGAFKRVWVNYLVKTTPTIYWELERAFNDPGPYSFQLQGSHAGVPRADDWINIGSPTSSFFAQDHGQRLYGKTMTWHYRIKLTTTKGIYYSPIANVLGLLNKHDWLIVREILRKEQLAHKIFSSVRGYLLKARRYGPECTQSRYREVNDQFTDEIIDTNCPLCYGTGFSGGYYPATEYYALLTQEKSRESRSEKTGTSKDVVLQGRFLGTLPLIQNDVWVNIGSDERYYLHSVAEAAEWKSVPVVYSAELRLAPFTDAVYDVPLT